MMDFRKVLRAICAGVVVMVAGATPCRAVDYQPFDWVPAPPGAGNLGQNRWQHDLQVDFTQTLFETFTVDVSGVWTYYGKNTDAGPAHQVLAQDSSWSAYAWLTYDVTSAVRRAMPTAGRSSLSVGYAGTFGGAVKLDGVLNGTKTEEHQIRFSYSQFVVPTWQVLLSLSRDVSATGQFK